jgi:PAS domain S-box-containing protein
VGCQHVGNIFSGQFFFDNEPLDYELFRSQARKYGFDEEEYIKALEKVPRLSKEAVDASMVFLTKLANMISQLSYSNIKLSQSLAERDSLVNALQKNREDLDRAQAVGNLGSWRLNVRKNELTWSDEAYRIFGIPKGTPLTYETFLSRIHTDDRKYVDKKWKAGLAGEPYDIEHRIIVDGKVKWVREKAYIEFDNDGTLFGGFGITQDITNRKDTEEMLAFERSQLLSIFDGIDDAVYVTDPYTYEVLYANKAMKEKFDGELVGGICYREFQERDFPCDFCTNPIILKERDKPYHWEYYNPAVDRYFMIMDRIIKWPDGRDVRFEIAKDITERKRAEEALRISEEKYRSLFNSIDEGFNIIEIIFDESGKAVDHRILEANPSQEKMTGLKDVVGKRARELLPNFEDYWLESFSQVVITGEPVRLENRIEELDRWFDVYASRFGDEGSRKVAVVFNDITQRKLAEEALHQSEKRLNFALETIHTGAWDLDLVNHDSPHRSLEHDRIFGYEQLLPKWTYEMFLNHVLPEDRAMVDEKYQKAITSGGDWSFECRIRRVDGVIRWIWAAGRHQVDYTGNLRWMAGIVQDITERKRAEEALRESKERLRLLSDNLPDSAVYQYAYKHDGSVRFLYFSAGIERLNGVSVSDVLRDPGTLHRQIPPEYFERLLEAEAKSARELSDFDMETPMQLPDGQIRWMQLHSRPRRLPDGRTIWDGVQIDITERKRTEEALKDSEARIKVAEAIEFERKRLFDVLETLPAMICLLTPDYHVAFANRSFREKFGESNGRHCYEYRYGLTKPCEFCESYKVLETGQSLHWEVNTPDGSIIDSYDFPFTDIDGSPMILVMDIDVTERKKAEEALSNIETARKKEIHHRIKNNLQVISSLLDLQAEQFRNRENIKELEVLKAFRESQDRVISMALIHEELYKGGGFDTLDFSPYIKKLIENLFKTYSLGDAEIALNMDLEESIFFDMDIAVPLGMIVNELVSNSLKHAFKRRKQGEIQIKLLREKDWKHKKEGDKDTNFVLSVSDNGIGIPGNLDIKNIDSLGIQLVTSLVDQLDGEFELKKNNGTEFNMKFTVTEKGNLTQVGLK